MLKEEKAKADRAVQELSDQKELQLREKEVLSTQLEVSAPVVVDEAPIELIESKSTPSGMPETQEDNAGEESDPSDLGGALVQAAVSSSTPSEYDSRLTEIERVGHPSHPFKFYPNFKTFHVTILQALKRKEADISALQQQVKSLEQTRDSLAEELVQATQQVQM